MRWSRYGTEVNKKRISQAVGTRGRMALKQTQEVAHKISTGFGVGGHGTRYAHGEAAERKRGKYDGGRLLARLHVSGNMCQRRTGTRRGSEACERDGGGRKSSRREWSEKSGAEACIEGKVQVCMRFGSKAMCSTPSLIDASAIEM